jgi:hypothetical protein|tara:strand:- start:272 stop:451 length:180 start_codon:yes stop_codon:yes gene_type:complete
MTKKKNDEWVKPEVIGIHPTLVKLAEKTKKLIELENLLLITVKSEVEAYNEKEANKGKQ